jgi:IclR family transcriptional regulator, acetate operon repressor
MAQPSTEPRSGTVQSVERVFELLEIIADAGGEASLSDLAAASELPMPTIHRLLRTCVLLGYARQLPSRRYALGARLIPLGERAGRQLGRVAQQPSPHAMRMFTEVGRRANLHDTGVGKAILATLSDDEVRRIIARTGMATPTSKSHATIDSLLADLADIRRRGYSIDDEEQELGVRCYAVSIPKAPAPMAVSVSGPLSRVDEAFGDRAVPVLQGIAERVGNELIG